MNSQFFVFCHDNTITICTICTIQQQQMSILPFKPSCRFKKKKITSKNSSSLFKVYSKRSSFSHWTVPTTTVPLVQTYLVQVSLPQQPNNHKIIHSSTVSAQNPLAASEPRIAIASSNNSTKFAPNRSRSTQKRPHAVGSPWLSSPKSTVRHSSGFQPRVPRTSSGPCSTRNKKSQPTA